MGRAQEISDYQTGIRRKIEWLSLQQWLLGIVLLAASGTAGYAYILFQAVLTQEMLLIGAGLVFCIISLSLILYGHRRALRHLLIREDAETLLRLDLLAANREALAETLSEFTGSHRRTLTHLSLGEECLEQAERINQRTLRFVAAVTAQHGDMQLSDAVHAYVATAMEARGVEATAANVVRFIERHSPDTVTAAE